MICNKINYDVPAIIIPDAYRYDVPPGLIWWHIAETSWNYRK